MYYNITLCNLALGCFFGVSFCSSGAQLFDFGFFISKKTKAMCCCVIGTKSMTKKQQKGGKRGREFSFSFEKKVHCIG
jgi:hypothetical protein